ncbi:unnamed protein product [Allacma fusca]|uniref:Galactokinase n=1 Tax=Allacma fusca TaxID=39272 RepID=A0A8J2KIS9_9HEXA|nr:unnamed protein product [Allacma fusca]
MASQGQGDVKRDLVPVQALSKVVSSERVEGVRNRFQSAFGHSPQFFLRVPGRVNLIGEHIDYCGYAVLPMAIGYDVLIAGRSDPKEEDAEPTVRVINVNSTYPDFSGTLSQVKRALVEREEGKAPEWYLYVFCGLMGVVEELKREGNSRSLEICVDGRVPARAGLSSSSALVCAATLATLQANNITLSKNEIADLSARSERYIGTQGGGMDQAIAMLATAGSAQFIEFIPKLKASSVSLPKSAVFVVANSLAEANKAANDSYNYRVTECRFATWILAKKRGLKIDGMWKPLDLQLELKATLDELLGLVDKELHEEPYTVSELMKVLNVDESFLRENSTIKATFSSSSTFKLRQRIQHVYSEAGRVELFRSVCQEELGYPGVLRKLGKLMNMSHQSLRELYQCSHPQLDTLVHLAQDNSHGARLTGAGWGGCAVALLERAQLENFLAVLKSKYYEPVLGISDIQEHVFVTTPSQGASILEE